MNLSSRILNRIKRAFNPPPPKFDATGERVDITYNSQLSFDAMDMYQKSHFRRYEYAMDLIQQKEVCGDFACGTGYGSVMLSKKAEKVIGADINGDVISAIKKRYRAFKNIEFIEANLLNLTYKSFFDTIVSFETIEHFPNEAIRSLLGNYHNSIKPGGKIIFSTPYMQERSDVAIKMGHHQTFYINEEKIEKWLADAGFVIELYKYQNYDTHTIENSISKKDFIICVAKKQ